MGKTAAPCQGPDAMRYWEDLVEGEEHQGGSYLFTREEIIEFASRFDPQPFHLDEEAARQTPYRGLIASGWHIGSVAMRLLVDQFVGELASLGSPGVDKLRWLHPVRPGDVVKLKFRILHLRPMASKTDRGLATVEMELMNQEGVVVMRMESPGMVGRRG